MSSVNGLSSGNSAQLMAAKYSVASAKKALDAQKQEGQAALALIQSAEPPPAQGGNGNVINIYA